MTDEQAEEILTRVIEPVLELELPPSVMEVAIWMELEAQFGPLVKEAFYVDLDHDEKTLGVGPLDRVLAEKLLKRHLPQGYA
jgi:hypothetical protein